MKLVGDFNTSFQLLDRYARQNIRKDIRDLIEKFKEQGLIEYTEPVILKYLNMYSFQVHMKHSTG